MCVDKKRVIDLLLLSLQPRLTLFLPIIDSQFLQHHISPVIARAVTTAHQPCLLEKVRQ